MSRLVAILGVAFAGVAWFACIGEDPGPVGPLDGGVATGDRLGPCFGNGTCKDGLVCRDGAICLAPDEPRPATDGSEPGAESDAGVRPPCPAPLRQTPDGGMECLGADGEIATCSASEQCCMGLGCRGEDEGVCPPTAPLWRCVSAVGCANGSDCRLELMVQSSDRRCASFIRQTGEKPTTGSFCRTQEDAGGARKLCENDGQCAAGGTCQRVLVAESDGGVALVGLCGTP